MRRTDRRIETCRRIWRMGVARRSVPVPGASALRRRPAQGVLRSRRREERAQRAAAVDGRPRNWRRAGRRRSVWLRQVVTGPSWNAPRSGGRRTVVARRTLHSRQQPGRSAHLRAHDRGTEAWPPVDRGAGAGPADRRRHTKVGSRAPSGSTRQLAEPPADRRGPARGTPHANQSDGANGFRRCSGPPTGEPGPRRRDLALGVLRPRAVELRVGFPPHQHLRGTSTSHVGPSRGHRRSDQARWHQRGRASDVTTRG